MDFDYQGSEYEEQYLKWKEQQEKNSITEEKTVGQLLYDHPELAVTLKEFGMHCIACPAAQKETLKEAAQVHHLEWDTLKRALESAVAAK